MDSNEEECVGVESAEKQSQSQPPEDAQQTEPVQSQEPSEADGQASTAVQESTSKQEQAVAADATLSAKSSSAPVAGQDPASAQSGTGEGAEEIEKESEPAQDSSTLSAAGGDCKSEADSPRQEQQAVRANPSGNVTEEDVYDALLAAALDAEVSESAGIALGVLGGRAEGKLVERAAEMIAMHTKALSTPAIRGGMCHRAALYRVVRSVLSTAPSSPDAPSPSRVGQEVAEHLAGLAVTDVLLEPNAEEAGHEVTELREASAAVLSQLASTHMSSVLSKLLPRLETATMFEQQQAQKQKLLGRKAGPSVSDSRQQQFIRVLEMIQLLAKQKKEQMGGHFKRVLSAMLPVMGMAVSSQTKQAWAQAMISCCEAVQYTWEEAAAGATLKEKLDAGGFPGRERDQALEYAVQAAYDVVATTWTTAKDAQVQQTAFLSLAAMTCLMPHETLDERLSGVISKLCQLLQGLHVGATVRDRGQGTAALLKQAGAFTHSLRSVAEAATNHGQVLGQHAGEVMLAVLPVACCPPDYLDRPMQAAYNSSLVLFEALTRLDAPAVTDFLLANLHPERRSRKQVVAEPARLHWGCLAVLNHIVRRVQGCLSSKDADILQSLTSLSSSPDPMVRIQIADMVMAMAPDGLLDREGGQSMVRFLVACAAGASVSSAQPARRVGPVGFFSSRGAQNAAQSEQSARAWWWPRSSGSDADPRAQLQRVAGNALYLLATTVPKVEPLLWPELVGYLGEPAYASAQAGLCRGIAVVVRKLKDGNLPVAIDYQLHPRILSAPALVARLFVPLFGSSRHGNATVNIIEALTALADLYPPAIATLWTEKLPELLEAMPACGGGGGEGDGREQWVAKVLGLFEATLQRGPGLSFDLAVGDALMEQRAIYEGEEEPRAGLSMLLGVVFGKVEEATYVRVGLHDVFWETNHLSALERRGCSKSFEGAAGPHFVAAVEVLEDILKRDSAHAHTGIASITAGFLAVSKRVRKALEPDNEPQIATALLACGAVVREGSSDMLQQHLHSILALAHPCLPGGARYHFLRGAKIVFIEQVGKAVMENNANLHRNLVMDHVDKVLQAVPQLISFSRDPVTKLALEEQNVEAISKLLNACGELASLKPGFSLRAFVPLVSALSPMFDLLSGMHEGSPTMRRIYQGVSEALCSGVKSHPSMQLVCEVTRPLEKYFVGSSDSDRLRACALTCAVLHTVAISQLTALKAPKSPKAATDDAAEADSAAASTDHHTAQCLALLLPRIADCSSRVAQVATIAVRTVCKLAKIAAQGAGCDVELEAFADVEWVMGEAGAPEEVWDWGGSAALGMLRNGAEEGRLAPPAQSMDGKNQQAAAGGSAGSELSVIKASAAGSGGGGGRLDQAEEAQRRVRAMVQDVAQGEVLGGEGVVICLERLLMAIRFDSHLKGSDGAATSLSELLRLTGADLAPRLLGAFTRKVLAVGSQASRSSKQYDAAVSCVVQATRISMKQVVSELLGTEEEMEQYLPHPQAQAVRAFSVACIASIVVERALGAALVQHLCELLVESELSACGEAKASGAMSTASNAASYTSLKDMAGKGKVSWREELGYLLRSREQAGEKGNEPWDPARAGRDLPLLSMANEARQQMSMQVGTPLSTSVDAGSGDGQRKSVGRFGVKKYAAKLLSELLQEPGARVALEVNRNLMAAVLAVRVGTIAIEKSLDDDNPASLGAKGSLLADLFEDGQLWPEIKATVQQYIQRCKLHAVDHALQARDVWAGLGSVDFVLDSLQVLALLLFSALPEAGAELAQYLVQLGGPKIHASQRSAAAVCFAALVQTSEGKNELLDTLCDHVIARARDESVPSHVRKHVITASTSLFGCEAVMRRAGKALAEMLLDSSSSDFRALQYAAGAVLPVCMAALPLQAAVDLAPRVKNAIGLWLRSEDPLLRANAATLSGALHTFISADQLENGAARAGGGDSGVGELAEMVAELLPFLLLALADSAHAVRIASKRSIRLLALEVYRGCEPITQLLQSSALDERWQTDLPVLLSSLLQLFHAHRPDDVQRYLDLVVTSRRNERAEMVAGIATLSGAFLGANIAVDRVARQLLLLLEHPDLQVRCSAADALQHFTPVKPDNGPADPPSSST